MKKTLLSVTIAAVFSGLASGSAMALEQRPVLSLDVAKKMAAACESKAKQENWKMNIAIVLASDDKSFFAFELPAAGDKLSMVSDTLLLNNNHFRIDGKGIDTSYSLKQLQAYQEFWHSWRTFNPGTKR